jgi:hypothetical protein
MKIMVRYGPDDEPKPVELRELNLMFHRGMFDVEIVSTEDGRPVKVLQSPETVHEGEKIEPHWAFWVFWEALRAGGIEHLPKTVEEIRRSGRGFTHLAGLVNLQCKYAFDQPWVFVHIRYPESHLHPDAQCALGDYLIAMSKPWKTVMDHVLNGRDPKVTIPLTYKDQRGQQHASSDREELADGGEEA